MYLYSLDDAAALLGINRNTVSNRIKRDSLDSERVLEGGRERVYVLLDIPPDSHPPVPEELARAREVIAELRAEVAAMRDEQQFLRGRLVEYDNYRDTVMGQLKEEREKRIDASIELMEIRARMRKFLWWTFLKR